MAEPSGEPKLARNTTLKGAIAIGLDECIAALDESLQNLGDEQAWSYPLPHRHNITTLAMHCQHNLDEHACFFQGGGWALTHQDRFSVWARSIQEVRAQMDGNLPTVAEMRRRLSTLRTTAMGVLGASSEQDLLGPRPGVEWFTRFNRTAADAYMRTIMHTMAHVRQIWYLRGVMGISDRAGFPHQHWA